METTLLLGFFWRVPSPQESIPSFLARQPEECRPEPRVSIHGYLDGRTTSEVFTCRMGDFRDGLGNLG